jgi:hypothetical protein
MGDVYIWVENGKIQNITKIGQGTNCANQFPLCKVLKLAAPNTFIRTKDWKLGAESVLVI